MISLPDNHDQFVADTMALVLRVEGRRLGIVAKACFERVESGAATMWIPGMVWAEVLYLAEKRRIQSTFAQIAEYADRFNSWRQHPLDRAIVEAAAEITDVPELHDRLIAATARYLQAPILTNDPAIQASNFVQAIW